MNTRRIMQRLEKFLLMLETIRQSFVFRPATLLLTFILLVIPLQVAHANAILGFLGNALTGLFVAGGVGYLIYQLIFSVLTLAIEIASALVDWLLQMLSILIQIVDVVNIEAVKEATGSFNNLVLIVVIPLLMLIIGATVLGIQNYSISKLLFPLLVIVVAVPFVPILIGAFLDFLNVIVATIYSVFGQELGVYGENIAAVLYDIFAWDTFTLSSAVKEGLGDNRALPLTASLNRVETIIFFILLVLLLRSVWRTVWPFAIRMVILPIVVITSPLAILSSQIPFLNALWNLWKENLIKYAIMPVKFAGVIAFGFQLHKTYLNSVNAYFAGNTPGSGNASITVGDIVTSYVDPTNPSFNKILGVAILGVVFAISSNVVKDNSIADSLNSFSEKFIRSIPGRLRKGRRYVNNFGKYGTMYAKPIIGENNLVGKRLVGGLRFLSGVPIGETLKRVHQTAQEQYDKDTRRIGSQGAYHFYDNIGNSPEAKKAQARLRSESRSAAEKEAQGFQGVTSSENIAAVERALNDGDIEQAIARLYSEAEDASYDRKRSLTVGTTSLSIYDLLNNKVSEDVLEGDKKLAATMKKIQFLFGDDFENSIFIKNQDVKRRLLQAGESADVQVYDKKEEEIIINPNDTSGRRVVETSAVGDKVFAKDFADAMNAGRNSEIYNFIGQMKKALAGDIDKPEVATAIAYQLARNFKKWEDLIYSGDEYTSIGSALYEAIEENSSNSVSLREIQKSGIKNGVEKLKLITDKIDNMTEIPEKEFEGLTTKEKEQLRSSQYYNRVHNLARFLAGYGVQIGNKSFDIYDYIELSDEEFAKLSEEDKKFAKAAKSLYEGTRSQIKTNKYIELYEMFALLKRDQGGPTIDQAGNPTNFNSKQINDILKQAVQALNENIDKLDQKVANRQRAKAREIIQTWLNKAGDVELLAEKVIDKEKKFKIGNQEKTLYGHLELMGIDLKSKYVSEEEKIKKAEDQKIKKEKDLFAEKEKKEKIAQDRRNKEITDLKSKIVQLKNEEVNLNKEIQKLRSLWTQSNEEKANLLSHKLKELKDRIRELEIKRDNF